MYLVGTERTYCFMVEFLHVFFAGLSVFVSLPMGVIDSTVVCNFGIASPYELPFLAMKLTEEWRTKCLNRTGSPLKRIVKHIFS